MINQCLPIDKLPGQLLGEFERCKETFTATNSSHLGWFEGRLVDPDFTEQLTRTWVGSRYAANLCIRRVELFREVDENGLLQRPYADGELARRVIAAVDESQQLDCVETLDSLLRRSRAREMLRIIWRDLNRLSDLVETTRDISDLADVSIQLAVGFHHRQLSSEFGVPCAKVGAELVEQELIVLGMGKLGANELNLSSDIDLIFTYPNSGKTISSSETQKSLDNHQFFTRLGQKVISSLDKTTVDGFVFRVDMRLRPFGDSGALVQSFDAMEQYYQDQGRDWERYAMIKARVVTGDSEQGLLLSNMLRPFVFRRYIDFSVIDSLRAMKKMIVQEVARRHLENDVKLGAGGIRDIEFIVQSFQLIRGGREKALQERRLLDVLTTLASSQYLSADAASELESAYIFLRNTEHVLQAFNDQQTQALPENDYPRQVVAYLMGFESWGYFAAALAQHRAVVSLHFQGLISDRNHSDNSFSNNSNNNLNKRSGGELANAGAKGLTASESEQEIWLDVWLQNNTADKSVALLEECGHEQAQDIVERLDQLRMSATVLRMQAVGRERLDKFVPLLLAAVNRAQYPSATLLRILPLLEAVIRRTAYLVLLSENPVALQQLVVLCAASPWVAAQLAKHPVLLDELLDSRTIYSVPDKDELRSELHQQMLRIPLDDLEAHMEGLRYFKQAHQLRASAAEVSGHLELMKVSDYLSIIAEVILEHVLEVAWYYLVQKHGVPGGDERPDAGREKVGRHFIIVAYGKLGGAELGHSSDLDLVFIYEAAAGQFTNGDRPLDNSVFFTRLGQRMIHILTAQTSMGDLYEVDMRLRPSGESGLLVTSLKAFAEYQHNSAWTWEHQAIVRARVVAGDAALATDFDTLRRNILCLPRDESKLRSEVADMREKMRDHSLPKGIESAKQPAFHLKHGSGAIVDIEFMVQYAVLAWSHQYPALADYPDNIRILQSLQQQGLFSDVQSRALIEAYKVFRSRAHRLSLLRQPHEVPMAEYESLRRAVIDKWSELMSSAQ